MKPVLPCLLLILSATACRKHATSVSVAHAPANTLVAGTFIDRAGTFTHDDGTVTRELVTSPGPSAVNCMLSYREQRPGMSRSSSSGHTIPLSKPGAPWFVYVERPGRLWFFNGKDRLDYDHQNRDGTSSSGDAIHSGTLVPSAPPIPVELIPRLPASLRKLLPAANPESPRPSF